MNLDYIKQRLWEQHEYFSILKSSSDKDLEEGKDLINKIKSSETSKEDRKVLFNNFKRNQIIGNLKLAEIDKTINTMMELISLAKVLDVDLGFEDDVQNIYETYKDKLTPLFDVKGDTIKVLNDEYSTLIESSLSNASENDDLYISKLVNS